ncbi:DNA-binding response regulator [Caballeronia sp. LjRoot34]|uniref:response regulator transcription factor n=1 Tax=Caballeronia sp. LjRoot34 TaxID=3342325 RepID=UPI003ECFD423
MLQSPALPKKRRLRILVVDDNHDDRSLLTHLLSQLGHRVYIAGDGHDGYGKAQALLPDLILMDISMPVCDGLVACRLLKASPLTRPIPLMFLTAAALPRERVEGLAAGAIDYVTKPFDFEEVRLRLSIHIRDNVDDLPLVSDGFTADASTFDAVLFRATSRLLLERLGETPDLTALAQSVGTNTRRLNLAFRRCVGVTVFDYLREERMKNARRLVCETTLDFQVIGKSLGYGGGANFSTAFRERFGLSPSALRRVSSRTF